MAYIGANNNTVEAYSPGYPPAVSLTAQTSIQNGTALDGLAVRQNAVMAVSLSATATAGTIVLQASLDGQNWWATSATISPTAAGTTSASVAGVYARYVRAAITVATVPATSVVTVSVGLHN